MYFIDPINVGEEIMEPRVKINNIEQMMDKIMMKPSAAEPNPPQQSQPDLPLSTHYIDALLF